MSFFFKKRRPVRWVDTLEPGARSAHESLRRNAIGEGYWYSSTAEERMDAFEALMDGLTEFGQRVTDARNVQRRIERSVPREWETALLYKKLSGRKRTRYVTALRQELEGHQSKTIWLRNYISSERYSAELGGEHFDYMLTDAEQEIRQLKAKLALFAS